MVTSTPTGALIEVRVIPRAARSGLAGTREGTLLVRLHAAPVEGAANAELIGILSDMLGIPRRAVTIVQGEHARRKRVHVEGVSAELARSILKLG
jgi:uncharacterized protein (TIGR00251 family)